MRRLYVPSHGRSVAPALAAFLLLVLLSRPEIGALSQPVEIPIPCNCNSTPFVLSSHQHYLLRNCSSSDCNGNTSVGSFVPLTPNCSGSLENTSVFVKGGSVLPHFQLISCSALHRVENVSLTVQGVEASFTLLDCPLPVAMLWIRNVITNVTNVTLNVEDTQFTMTVIATQSAATVAPLLFLPQSIDAVVGVSVSMRNSTFSLVVTGGAHNESFVGFLYIASKRISQVTIVVQNSNMSLMLTTMNPAVWKYVNPDPSLFFLGQSSNTTSVVIFAETSKFDVDNAFPRVGGGNNSAEDFASVVFLHKNEILQSASITFNNTLVFVRCVCRDMCSNASNPTRPRARVVEVQSSGQVSAVAIVFYHSTITMDSPRSIAGVAFENSDTLRNISVSVVTSTIYLTSSNLNFSDTPRGQKFITLEPVNECSDTHITITNSSFTTFSESGGCTSVSNNIIALVGNVSFSSVVVDRVNVSSQIVNGSANLIGVAPLFVIVTTVATSIVSLTEQLNGAANPGIQVNLSLRCVVMSVTHALVLDPSAFAVIVLSIAVILNALRSMENSIITFEDVHLERYFSERSATWFPDTDSATHLNVTLLACLFDPQATIVGLASKILPLFDTSAFPTVSTNLSQRGLHLNITSNSTIAYRGSTTLSNTDCVGFVVLPAASTNSWYLIEDSFPASDSTQGVTVVGGIIGTLGPSRVTDTFINARRVNGMSLLFFATYGDTTLHEFTTLTFDNITLQRCDQGKTMHNYTIGSESGSITATPPPNRSGSFFIVNRSTFNGGFKGMIMPSTLTRPEPPAVLLYLGCSLMNGAPLSRRYVGADPSVVPYIQFPRSKYNTTVRCDGFGVTRTVSRTSTAVMTQTMLLPAIAAPSSVIPSESVSVIVGVAGVLGAILGSAAATGLLDAQLLVAIGQSGCAPGTLRSGTSSSQFLISPFYEYDAPGMVLGNIGIFLVLHAAHRALVALHRRYVYRTQMKTCNTLLPASPAVLMASTSAAAKAVASIAPLPASPPSVPPPQRPEEAVKYPNVSYAVGVMLASGVVCGMMRGVFSGDALNTVTGAIGLVTAAAGIWWRVRVGRSAALRRFRFTPYRHRQRQTFAAPWALPLGQWGPSSLRATHGRIRGAVRPSAEWLSALPLTSGLTVQGIASISVPESWCIGLWFLLCVIQCITLGLVAVYRPARAPLTDILQGIGLAMAAVIKILAGLASSHVEGLDTPLAAVSITAMLWSTVKTGHTLLVVWWERRQASTAATNPEAAAAHENADRSNGQSLGRWHDELAEDPRQAATLSLTPARFLSDPKGRIFSGAVLSAKGTSATHRIAPPFDRQHAIHEALRDLVEAACGRWANASQMR